MGALSLGAVVNLLSSPVIVGFTNAAALIIGLSQLSKILGVPFPRTESYLADLWRVIEQIPEVHVTTLAVRGRRLAADRRASALPTHTARRAGRRGVATMLSALIGFEQKITVKTEQIADAPIVAKLEQLDGAQKRMAEITTELADIAASPMSWSVTVAWMRSPGLPGCALRSGAGVRTGGRQTRRHPAAGRVAPCGSPGRASGGRATAVLRRARCRMASTDGRRWRLQGVRDGHVTLSAGGDVVGVIPEGLPSFEVPVVHWDLVLALLPAALVMALIGFMEATSISKAIATSTGERVDTNKELIGQGLANIAGSFFSSYTVSGSFSRSAVAARTGAKTGLFAIISALAVVLVLLFFTRYLYHLPQAVLAVIVMMAVFSLIRIGPLVQAWKVDRVGALIGVVTFVATLVMAPAIANGILLGVVSDRAALPDPHDETARRDRRAQTGRHAGRYPCQPLAADERILSCRYVSTVR